jgi:hypothetical protein
MTSDARPGRIGCGKRKDRCRPRAAAICLLLAALALFGIVSGAVAAEIRTNEWIRGFTMATLVREFEITPSEVVVDDGSLRVTLDELPTAAELDTVVRGLLEIPGVEDVEIYLDEVGGEGDEREEGGDGQTGPGPPIATGSDRGGRETTTETLSDEDEASHFEMFPESKLFEPLISDPRWPRFALTSTWYLDDPELSHVADVSFGVTLPLLRVSTETVGDFEFGIQGGVFSVFDFDSDSFDLVNSDFIGGLFGSYRLENASAMLRFYHQSSHLGDEFLLRNRVDRVNLSFEVLDLLLSYDFWTWLRIYAGGGVIVHREPSIDRGLLEAGTELQSPEALLNGWLRPFTALDLQFREESDWNTDLSLTWGLRLEHPRLRRTPIALVGEYYWGRSPNGQFYTRRIETIGLGIQIDF